MEKVEVQGGMQDEQAADFAALMAAATDGAPLPQGEEPAPEVEPGEQWAMIPAMLGSALSMALPELKEVYSEDACRAWGSSMVPVAEKYGWNADGILCPEVGLLAASLPFIVGTLGAVNRRKALAVAEARKAIAGGEKPRIMEAAPAVKAGTVQFGEVQAHGAS
ncbi:MAG TPA: hypothetical protein VJ673_02745 [Aromatoleum sp.]|uniref:hypothetical protein n=1 Tax=Aromatoleum sp. TaxID=2307007 RepID=UPI002B4622F1|nr:hypothetical protein [Aromatoleum sp.]HJV24571.1 hypothetical protein [Aromatoleum sp.]